MAYGTIKVDTVTFTDGGIDKSVTLSGLVQNPTFSGDVTVTGTLSGVTVTGTTANFTSGVFTSISGATVVLTSGVFASGTAAAPSVSVGTTSNGIYSPGTNQLALSTNGTGRLFVDASGRVGINNASPSAALSVSALSNDIAVFEQNFSGTEPALVINNLSGNSNSGSRISFRNTGTERAYIEYQLGTGTTPSLRFGAAGNERLRITSAGNVGIGTTSPSTNMHVFSDYSNILIEGSNVTSGSLVAGISVKADNYRKAGLTIYDESDNEDFFIGRPYAGTNNLVITNDGQERARIDSSGRLLVGASSAFSGYQFEVASTTGAAAALSQFSANNQSALLRFNKSRGSVGTHGIVAANDDIGYIDFRGSDGANLVPGAAIAAEVDGTPGTNDMPGRIVLSTTPDGSASPVERMRINSSGYVYIAATTSPNTAFLNLTCGSATASLSSDVAGGVTSTRTHFVFSNSNGIVGSVTTNGSATAYNTSSDYRLKENVTPVTDGITRLQQLKPSRFNFIADPTKTVDGFLAHEVQTIVPEAITGEKDEVDEDGNPLYQGIDQSKLVPLLTAALQEAVAEINALKVRVAALESA